jgi:hypothetical protein
MARIWREGQQKVRADGRRPALTAPHRRAPPNASVCLCGVWARRGGHYCNVIEAPWLVNGGHGASLIRRHRTRSRARSTGSSLPAPSKRRSCSGSSPRESWPTRSARYARHGLLVLWAFLSVERFATTTLVWDGVVAQRPPKPWRGGVLHPPFLFRLGGGGGGCPVQRLSPVRQDAELFAETNRNTGESQSLLRFLS